MPESTTSIVIVRAVGGLLPDAVRFAKKRYEGFPDWFKKPGYWCGLLVLVILGAIAAWLSGATNWQMALAAGYAAPEVISRLLGSEDMELREEEQFNLRKWWTR